MSHPLETNVAGVRRRARLLLVSYALAWTVVMVVVTVVILGAVDYLFHMQDRGIRVIFSLSIVAVCGYSAWRFLWPAFAYPLDDVQIARRIEERFPELNDRLASSVEFLRQEGQSDEAGSAQLRRAVIVSTAADVQRLKLRDVINLRPTLRAIGAVASVCLVAAALIALDTASARLALSRLANPLGDLPWPRENDLVFVDPPRYVALGQPFEIKLVDHNDELPDEVRIFYRYEGDGPNDGSQHAELMQRSGQQMIARKENVSRPFEYYAIGGDGRTETLRLEVVEPPRIESLELTVTPPAYTGWPAVKSAQFIRALRGSQITAIGTATKKLLSATLQREPGEPIAARIADDGFGFVIDGETEPGWSINKSGKYHVELDDGGEVPGGAQSHWEVRAVNDRPPVVNVEHPVSNLFVTAHAVVRLKISVKDDLAVQNVVVRFARSDRSNEPESELVLHTGPERAEPAPEGTSTESMVEGDLRRIEYSWDLAGLKLPSGTQVNFYAAANDYQPKEGQSPSRRLTIITPHELEDRIAQRQSFILGEVARALKMQRAAREKTRELSDQIEQIGKLRKQDLDQLQAAELHQRQVNRTLVSPTEGLLTQIAGLLDELKTNKIDSPQIERCMNGLANEVRRLDRDHLPAIQRDLTTTLKAAQSQPENKRADASVTDPLARAGEHQEHVISSLERLLGDLSKWEGYRQAYRDVGQLRRDQQELQQRTEQIGRGTPEKDFRDGTLGKDVRSLTPQQQSDLGKISRSELELARRFEKVLAGMEKMTKQLRDHDPVAADAVSDAARLARQGGIGDRMRRAGRQIGENQVSQAATQQNRAGRELQEMLDILQNRRENELSRLVKKLREAESKLQELRKKQKELRKQMDAAAKNANEAKRRRELQRLSKEQKKLEEETRRLARQLMRLQAQKAASSLARGAERMGQSGEAGQQGQSAEAQQQAEQAQKDLDEAQEQITKRRKQAERDLAEEQLARLEDAIASMHRRQQEVIKETERLNGLREGRQDLSRVLAGSIRDLARQQDGLRSETSALAKKMKSAAAFRMALDGADREMGRAVAMLKRQRTGPPTLKAEQDALARLAQVIKAFSEDGKSGQKKKKQAGSQGGQQKGGKGQTRSLAEVRLVKIMQEDLNVRTKTINQQRQTKKPLSAELAQEYAALGDEQSRLADLVFDLSHPAEETPDDAPDQLPDLEKELGDDLPLPE